MMKVFKTRLFAFLMGAIIFGGMSGVVAYNINARQVDFTPSDNTWKVKNVEEAIDDIKSKGINKKICKLVEGNALEIGSKYECNPNGDKTTKYNFYVLRVETNTVKLIMERNISDFVGPSKTMNWQSAMNFFRNGAGASLNWIVPVELPRAQDIADAVGNTSWNVVDKDYNGWFCFQTLKQDYSSSPYCNSQSSKQFLYDYTIECSEWGCSNSLDSNYAYGYWTGDIVNKKIDIDRAWLVSRAGNMGSNAINNSLDRGVRPVITIYKSNIS